MSQPLDAVAIGTCYVDTNVDSFPFSRDNLSAEELIGEQYELVPGGSAVNFCRLGKALGLQTAFIGMAGTDANGDLLERLLAEQDVQPDLVRMPNLQTNVGFNITNHNGDHLMFVAGTANAALSPKAVMPKLAAVLPQANMLYLGGCFKLKSFAHAFGEIAQLARHHSCKLVIDHGRIPYDVEDKMTDAVKNLVKQADYYFPSREEFCGLWGTSDIENGLKQIREQAPKLTVVVKDGARGAIYSVDGQAVHAPAEKVGKVVNATGAGDSFNAGVIAAIINGCDLPDAVRYGNKVAAAKIAAQRMPLL